MTADVAIIGGGIAGLALSIDLRERGYSVIVVEKGSYPRHKVCGEYIAMESQEYLQQLCPVLKDHHLPRINRFLLTTGQNKSFSTPLAPGGFGVSRYLLEQLLYEEASQAGVVFLLDTKALGIDFDQATGSYTLATSRTYLNVALVCNASGRKSNFEARETAQSVTGINYVGVKYHVKSKRDPAQIEIHNFPGGYCGISGIEEDTSCLCYLVNAKLLRAAGNSIAGLQEQVLFKNSRLKKIFTEAEFVFKDPLTISGVNFRMKRPVNGHAFFLGDSAGSIAPITGNGMSMGLRSAAMLANAIDSYFSGNSSRAQLEYNYSTFWKNEFARRIRLSRHFQRLSEYTLLTGLTIGLFNTFPALARGLIRQTHGQPF